MTEADAQKLPPKKVCLSCAKEYSPEMIICPDDDTLLTPVIVDTLIGTTLAEKYQILEKLGSGGMGLVYKARHNLMKRLVAIKLMLPQFAASATALKRFRQEAQAASHLNHPNILKVYDFGVTPQGLPYLVMDLLEGTNLSAELMAHGYLPLGRSLNIFVQTCAALSHAHQKGVIHRDLKPGNIMMVDYDGQHDVVQIVDFGMAKILSEMDAENEELTKTGEVFGSPMYMSPEQCMGKPLDARSDIYSLGCVMYRTLTGKPAVAGASAMECFNKHATALPAAFNEVAPELMLPTGLEKVVFRAMAKEIEDRYENMSELRDDLMSQLSQLSEISSSMPAGTVRPYVPQPSQVNLLQPHASLPQPILMDSQTQVSNVAMSPFPVADQQVSNATDSISDSSFEPASTPSSLAPTTDTGSGSVLQSIATTGAATTAGTSRYNTSSTKFNNIRNQTNLDDSNSAISQFQPPAKATRKGILWASIAGVLIIGGAAALTLLPKGQNTTPATTGSPVPQDNYAKVLSQGQSSFDHGDYSEALKKFKIAFDEARASGDYEHKVAEVRMSLGRTYMETQQTENAKKEFQEILKIRESEKKLSALDATEAMNELGKIYRAEGNFALSQQFFNKALALRQGYKGADHAAVAETLADMGNLALAQKQFKKATDLLAQAESIASTSQGLNELNKANIFSAIGQAYQLQGQYGKATSYYEKALALREKSLNPDNPAIADTLTYLGTLSFVQRNFDKAENYLVHALDIQKRTMSKDDPAIATTEFCLGVLYQKTKKYDKAEPMLADCLRIRTQVLGAKDADTVQAKRLYDSVKGK